MCRPGCHTLWVFVRDIVACGGWRRHAKTRAKRGKLSRRQWLGHDVGDLIVCVDVDQREGAFFDEFLRKMEAQANVLGPTMS